MTWMTTLSLLGGLGLLILGAEALVRGASRLAALLGISPLVIGLTVVAFGTSSPELAVSVQSTLDGQAGIALGNVVGSNIFNVLFILGLSAVLVPLVVAQQLIRLDVPIMIGASALVLILSLNGALERWEGALLFAALIAYTLFLIRQSRREHDKAVQIEYAKAYGSGETQSGAKVAVNVALALAGLGLLILGARWFVQGATDVARYFGLSELIIGLTIVAAGTSMPEVATSVLAAVRGERDIAVGNVVGSNLFNLFGVLGIATLVAPTAIPVGRGALDIDLPFMLVVAVACLPIFVTGHVIARWEGIVFLGYYAAYVLYLILTATEHDQLVQFKTFMLLFVIPPTILTIAISVARELRSRRSKPPYQ